MKILFYYNSVYYPGIALLSSFLRERGHVTDLLFDPAIGNNHYLDVPLMNRLISKKALIQKAKNFKPDLIAFSFVTNQFIDMQLTGRWLKKEISVPLITGGTHSTIMPEQVINEDWVDMVCIGEGEYALLELVEKMSSGKDYTGISNLWVKDSSGYIHKNSLGKLIQNLDDLPFADMDIFEQYGLIYERIDIITGRGCTNACSFCINSFKKKLYRGETYLRRRSPRNVIQELIQVKKKYKPKSFRFLDDTFAYDIDWLHEFGQDYNKHIALPYRCTLNPVVTDAGIISILKQSKCESVTMGLQSASSRVRSEIMNRFHTNSKIVEISDLLKKNKINMSVDLIFGTPTETPDEMMETIDFCSTLNLKSVTPSFFYPFPKTTLTEKCLNEGFLNCELYNKAINGEGSYHTTLLLNHPYKEDVYKYQAITPLYIKSGRLFKMFFKWMLNRRYGIIHRFFHLISVPLNEFYEFRRRIVMIPRVIRKTRKIVKKL